MYYTNKKKARGLDHLLSYEVKVKTLEISSFMEISKRIQLRENLSAAEETRITFCLQRD